MSKDQIHEVDQENQLTKVAKIVNSKPKSRIGWSNSSETNQKRPQAGPRVWTQSDPLRYGSENGRNPGGDWADTFMVDTGKKINTAFAWVSIKQDQFELEKHFGLPAACLKLQESSFPQRWKKLCRGHNAVVIAIVCKIHGKPSLPGLRLLHAAWCVHTLWLSHLWQTNGISAGFGLITELVWKDMIQRCLLLQQLEFWQRHSTGETPGSTKTLRWIDGSALRLVVNFEQQRAVECAYWGTHLLYIICFIYLSYPESSSVYRRFTPTPTYTPAQAHGKTMTCQKWVPIHSSSHKSDPRNYLSNTGSLCSDFLSSSWWTAQVAEKHLLI